MTMTKQQLRTKSLRHLGVLAASEEATSADAQLVDQAIDLAFAELESVVVFASSSIPDWAIDSMMRFVAAMVAPDFGIQYGSVHEARGLVLAARERRFGPGEEPKVVYF